MGSPVTIPNPAPGCSYLNYPRAVLNTPHPIYGGDLAGFGVGDLPTQFESGIPVFNAITANATSGLIDVAANAIELTATFSDLHTSCTITVFLADGETVVEGCLCLASARLTIPSRPNLRRFADATVSSLRDMFLCPNMFICSSESRWSRRFLSPCRF